MISIKADVSQTYICAEERSIQLALPTHQGSGSRLRGCSLEMRSSQTSSASCSPPTALTFSCCPQLLSVKEGVQPRNPHAEKLEPVRCIRRLQHTRKYKRAAHSSQTAKQRVRQNPPQAPPRLGQVLRHLRDATAELRKTEGHRTLGEAVHLQRVGERRREGNTTEQPHLRRRARHCEGCLPRGENSALSAVADGSRAAS